MHSFEEIFASFKNIKVGVVGDMMLDTYWWGHVDRISPEAPVPVVAVSHKEKRIGGAGNVALNISALGAQVQAISVFGKDEEAEELIALLQAHQIDTAYIVKSDQRITTNKIRIISRNQHMMRLDAELTQDINSEESAMLLKAFSEYVEKEKPQLIILEDYNKGVLTEQVIAAMIALCKQKNIVVAVDPKRKNFFAYKHADIFKPNLKEIREALNLLDEKITAEKLEQMHVALKEKLEHAITFITLSEKGVYYHDADSQRWIPTHVRSIADVSGAGDTVIAVASLVYAATRNVQLMAEMANIAGGLVCEEVGTVAINRDRLLSECQLLLNEG